MPKGYNGKILRVNLSSGSISTEEPSEFFYRRYIGGRGIGVYYLLKELKAGVEPFSSENKIIFAPSVITGAPIPGTSRFSVVAKSPLTGGYGEAEAGGYWGPELKFAGFDAIIIEGKASKPVYLWVHDGEAEIRDATHLWGKVTGDAQDIIRQELGDERVRVAIIGPAGENLVRYSCIVNDLKHVNGRTGLGAVMGSKNLKAVAVRGHKRLEFAVPEEVRRLARYFNKNFMDNADCNQLNKYGTSQYFLNANAAGTLPTRNYHGGAIEGAEAVGHEKLHEQLVIGSESCFACPVKCKRIVKADEPYEVDPKYGGPEFESITALSSVCGSTDVNVVIKANELCNKYTMDTISTGNVIAFAMECYENGLITKEDTGGIELSFGNAEAIVQMIELIAHRQGIGDLLAEGVKRASEKIGKGAEEFAMHVKGQEFPMHDPRGKWGMGLGFAVSPTGASHLECEGDGAFDPALTGYTHEADESSFFMRQLHPLAILEPVESLSIGGPKVRLFTYIQTLWSLFNCLEVCLFTPAPVRVFKISQYSQMVSAVTGWETTMWELMKVGERATTLTRVFNVKHGITSDDDRLPERLFSPLEFGALKGAKIPKEEFLAALPMYYQMMGWDKDTGIPTDAKLEELDIGWAKNELL